MLSVAPYSRAGEGIKLMLIGQDPTIARNPERVKQVLMLDETNGQLSRWLKKLFGKDNFESLNLYATNLVKCSFSRRPSTMREGGFVFLQPYFENCREYLAKEISSFQPTLVMTFGEPAHKLFISILDERHRIGSTMQTALGKLAKAKFRGVEFDYSPCLHIKTFRVAETYGEKVKDFKTAIKGYFDGDDRQQGFLEPSGSR